jgi:hypothetical protein
MAERDKLLEELSELQIEYLVDTLRRAKKNKEDIPASVLENARKTLVDHGIQVSPKLDDGATTGLDELDAQLKYIDDRESA